MKILVVGYGFYVLGDHNLEGGTVIRSIVSWLNDRPNHILSVDILVRSAEALERAAERLDTFTKKILVSIPDGLRSRIELNVIKNDSCRDYYDAAIIAVPEKNHLKVIEQISGCTKNVLIVKPVGPDWSENLKIQKICASCDCELFVDFHKRFDESNIAFVNTISKSACLEDISIFIWSKKPNAEGLLLQVGSHK